MTIRPGCPSPDACELLGCRQAAGCGTAPVAREPGAGLVAFHDRLAARLPAWAKPFAPVPEMEGIRVSDTPLPSPARPTAATRRPTSELRIQPLPGVAGAGGGYIIGSGDAPFAVASTEDLLVEVVRAWARGG